MNQKNNQGCLNTIVWGFIIALGVFWNQSKDFWASLLMIGGLIGVLMVIGILASQMDKSGAFVNVILWVFMIALFVYGIGAAIDFLRSHNAGIAFAWPLRSLPENLFAVRERPDFPFPRPPVRVSLFIGWPFRIYWEWIQSPGPYLAILAGALAGVFVAILRERREYGAGIYAKYDRKRETGLFRTAFSVGVGLAALAGVGLEWFSPVTLYVFPNFIFYIGPMNIVWTVSGAGALLAAIIMYAVSINRFDG